MEDIEARSYFRCMDAAEPDSADLLFAYGTLLIRTGIKAVDAAMKDAGDSLGRGYIHGHLYDLGDYPGAVPGEPGDAAPKVWGTLIRLRDPAASFAVLDAYEEFDAADPQGSEFIRKSAEVFFPNAGDSGAGRGFAGRIFPGQVYFYNRPVAGKRRIESGDFLAG